MSCLAAASAAHAQELWRQNPMDAAGGYSSQDARNPGGLGWFSETADNFQAQAGWRIGAIEFWGGYASDTPGQTEGFVVRFYNSVGNSIGARLYTADNLPFTETEYFSTFYPGIGTVRGYHYTIDLPTAFEAPADGRYWMSVVAVLPRGGDATEPQWGWVQSGQPNSPWCRQWFFVPGAFTSQGVDVAFVLHSAPPLCTADFNHSGGTPDDADVAAFFTAWNDGDGSADINASGGTPDDADAAFFFFYWSAGC